MFCIECGERIYESLQEHYTLFGETHVHIQCYEPFFERLLRVEESLINSQTKQKKIKINIEE